MTPSEKARLGRLRKRVMAAIEEELKIDNCCKSYEGTFEILESYPTYFDDSEASMEPDYYRITLHCYVLGPGRHYEWDGRTFGEAIEKAEEEIDYWLRPIG